MYICMHVEPSKNNTVFHKNTCSVEIINTSTCIMEIFFIIYSSKFLDYWFTASNAFNKHPKTGRISFYLSVKVAQTCIFFTRLISTNWLVNVIVNCISILHHKGIPHYKGTCIWSNKIIWIWVQIQSRTINEFAKWPNFSQVLSSSEFFGPTISSNNVNIT